MDSNQNSGTNSEFLCLVCLRANKVPAQMGDENALNVTLSASFVAGRPPPSRLGLSRGQPQHGHVGGGVVGRQRLWAARLRLPRIGVPQAQVLGQVRRVPTQGEAHVIPIIQ